MTSAFDSQNPWNRDRPATYTGTWLSTAIVQRHIRQKITGSPTLAWLDYCLDKHLGPLVRDASKRCLILGANEGWLERYLRAAGCQCRILATDIADKALARAQEASSALGYRDIEYRVADLNTVEFEGPFDAIIAEGVLHHIENTERMLRHLNAILTPDGILVAQEFEGPFRFQLSETQVKWINAALACVPGELRPAWNGPPGMPPWVDYTSHIHYIVPPEETIRAMDPTEAVAGPALKKLCPEIFRVIEKKGVGGTLLSYMGGHFPFELADADPYVGRFLELLLAIEDQVIRAGILEDDFVFYVFGKKLDG